jgi:hypothetical protein
MGLCADSTEKRESRRASKRIMLATTGDDVWPSGLRAVPRINDGGEQFTPFTTSFFSGVVRFEIHWFPIFLHEKLSECKKDEMRFVYSRLPCHSRHSIKSRKARPGSWGVQMRAAICCSGERSCRSRSLGFNDRQSRRQISGHTRVRLKRICTLIAHHDRI